MLSAALWAGGAGQLVAQSQTTPSQQPTGPQPPPATAQTPVTAPEATTNLDRIRQALNREPAIKIEDHRLRFYVEIVAKWPTFREFIGNYDLRNGPTRGSGMTHQEFLNHVTPRDFYGSAGIKPTELLQFAVVNWLGQTLAKKAIESFRNARDESELRAIRERIERELAALKGKDKDRP